MLGLDGVVFTEGGRLGALVGHVAACGIEPGIEGVGAVLGTPVVGLGQGDPFGRGSEGCVVGTRTGGGVG